MRDFLQELFERTPILLLIIGVILFLLGIAGGIATSALSLQIGDAIGRMATTGIGLALVVFSIYLVWQENVQSKPESKVDVKLLESAEELYKYAKKRIEQARGRVDDLTWGPPTQELETLADKQALDDYVDTIATICKRGVITYREVMAFPQIERIDVRLRRAEKMLKQNLFGYHLRYYEYPAEGIPPLLSFMIIDGEEVIIALYRYPYMPIKGEVRLAVRNPEIVRLFQDYYNTIWHGAKVLKEGDVIKWDVFRELQTRLIPQKADAG